jgi:hypothetical protein
MKNEKSKKVENKIDSIDPVIRSLRILDETLKEEPHLSLPDISENQITSKLIFSNNSVSNSVNINDSDNIINFGNKDFTTTCSITMLPPTLYINKTFVCPVCNYEAEHTTNLEGDSTNSPYCPVCFKKCKCSNYEIKKKEK